MCPNSPGNRGISRLVKVIVETDNITGQNDHITGYRGNAVLWFNLASLRVPLICNTLC